MSWSQPMKTHIPSKQNCFTELAYTTQSCTVQTLKVTMTACNRPGIQKAILKYSGVNRVTMYHDGHVQSPSLSEVAVTTTFGQFGSCQACSSVPACIFQTPWLRIRIRDMSPESEDEQ